MGSIQDILEPLVAQLNSDPQLPRANPTEAFWQLPPHPTLSAVQSPQLPQQTDYLIIGSGVTGCSVATNLFDNPAWPKDAHVTVLEARTLCSGATGRNGGALSSFVGYTFNKLVKELGEAEAIKIGRFAHRTLEKMHALGSSTPELLEASEVRRVRNVVGFTEQGDFEAGKASFASFDAAIPECTLNSEAIDAETARREYNIKNVVGVILYDNGAFWPYRLITRLWEQLLAAHPNNLAIETSTPATAISYDASAASHPYTVSTPRGEIRTSHIIHATNGWTGHLLSALRGKITPVRGTMSTQRATEAFGQHGAARGWAFSTTPHIDPQTGLFDAGLYYSNQNPKTHDIFIGGEIVRPDSIFVSDDTTIPPESDANIRSVLPRFFHQGWPEGETPEIRRVWSGLMGFTSDGRPLIGQLHEPSTGRAGTGEWVVAGFNGYGMPQCWSSGEAVAKLLLGQRDEVLQWLPQSYVATEERLAALSGAAVVQHFLS